MQDRYHFIGVGGIGMSALARILAERRATVSGSDLHDSYVTQGLRQIGVEVHIGHAANLVPPESTVVYSTDIRGDNEELKVAQTLNCKLLHRSELLQQLMRDQKVLAVTGTHGKTTTTALLAHVLSVANWDPSFAIGGISLSAGVNGRHGQGEFFVAEADESDGSFLRCSPFGAIVTNVEKEHLNFYGSEAALHQAFQQFIAQVQSPKNLVWCGDDPLLRTWSVPGVSYGFHDSCQMRITAFVQEGWEIVFDAAFDGQLYQGLRVPLIGRHNALNSSAVLAMALRLGIDESVVRTAFATFRGVKRRCETKAVVNTIRVLDDYGHHPTEVAATLSAIREAAPDARLIVAFQPHRYSRLKDLLNDFGRVFEAADLVFITEIYSANEEPIPGVSVKRLLEVIQQSSFTLCQSIFKEQLPSRLAEIALPSDVILTMGAGDITKMGEPIAAAIKAADRKKMRVGLIAGGQSSEHDVSLLTATQIDQGLDRNRYDICYFGISRTGKWAVGQGVNNQGVNSKDAWTQCNTIGDREPPVDSETLSALYGCDILLPAIHGPYSEDGRMQGFFETLGKPYVGCDVGSAAVSMDKVWSKRIALTIGLATAEFIDFSRHHWHSERELLLFRIEQQLAFPVFVKGIHLGSTISVQKVETPDGVAKAVEEAFFYDNHVLVERGIVGRELEFGVLGNEVVCVAPPAEVMSSGKINSYEDKYLPTGFRIEPHPDLSQELIEEGCLQARRIYEAVGCRGLSRIDFFLDTEGRYWFNEINPFPGCTPTSAFPIIWKAHGFPMRRVVDRLILLGLNRKKADDAVFSNPKKWTETELSVNV